MGRSSAKAVVQNNRGLWVLVWRTAPIHWAGLRDVPTDTGTDGVALVVHHTVGELTTGRRTASRARVLQISVVASSSQGIVVSFPLYSDEMLCSSRTQEEQPHQVRRRSHYVQLELRRSCPSSSLLVSENQGAGNGCVL